MNNSSSGNFQFKIKNTILPRFVLYWNFVFSLESPMKFNSLLAYFLFNRIQRISEKAVSKSIFQFYFTF
jgi:hypothetical protein